MLSENGTPVYYSGRLIGTIHHGEFQQTRRPNNFLRCGIAFDAGVLAEVERLGADRVRIRNGETGEVFTAGIAAIRKLGKAIDHGYGRQIALAFGHWRRAGDAPQRPQPAAAQLALFGGAV